MKESKKCLVRNGGLFIPLDDHIETYCTTLDYPQCLQYAMYANAKPELLEKYASTHENRRKYPRHHLIHKVTLVKLIDSNEVVSHLSSIANTLDLSKGGMRINLDTPLNDDTIINFTFEDFFPESIKHGSGQVQWCNKHVSEQRYQAGIAFIDDSLIENMGTYLEMNA